MNSLRKNFNEYIQIMDNHDMYNESVINIDSCNFLTPTIIAPLISLMYNYNKECSPKLIFDFSSNNFLA